MKENSFRLLLIDLLDNEHGLHEKTYEQLQSFSFDNFGHANDDVFQAVDGAEDRVWLEEEDAEEFRRELKS